MRSVIRLVVPVMTIALFATAAIGQTPSTIRIRGTIAAVDGQVMTVTTREGPKLPITLIEPVTVSAVKALDLAAIQPGSYVGAASEVGPDGQLQAIEVLVFPEAARGVGEGHREWDLKPGSQMTNATVTAAVQGTNGRDVDLAYKGGSKNCLLYTSPSPRDGLLSRMPSSA